MPVNNNWIYDSLRVGTRLDRSLSDIGAAVIFTYVTLRIFTGSPDQKCPTISVWKSGATPDVISVTQRYRNLITFSLVYVQRSLIDR
jgi:hypothetical protein